MAKSLALYVEDEQGDATARFQKEIESGGFEILRSSSAGEARRQLQAALDAGEIIDLVVLDRKLPETEGDQATEQTGDALFQAVEARLPDTPIIVLTGYSDEDFAVMVLQRENTVDLGLALKFQRVTHLRKGQALAFRQVLRDVGSALQVTENIAVEGTVADRRTRRVLKRVAQIFGGAVVKARPAASGASEADVWLCEVVAEDGRWLTSVVVKVNSHDVSMPTGGFMASVPPQNSAQPGHLVSGACGGACGHVAPLAGTGAVSLADELKISPPAACGRVSEVLEILNNIPAAMRNVTLAEFMSALIEWELAIQIATSHDIPLPDAGLMIPTHVGCLHGDLHPGNVILDLDRPVFIDFDRQRVGALVIDSLSLALGAVYNKTGPLKNSPPSFAEVENSITGTHGERSWFQACTENWSRGAYGERERWAAMLSFMLRQLKYPDIQMDEARQGLAVRLASRASRVLKDS